MNSLTKAHSGWGPEGPSEQELLFTCSCNLVRAWGFVHPRESSPNSILRGFYRGSITYAQAITNKVSNLSPLPREWQVELGVPCFISRGFIILVTRPEVTQEHTKVTSSEQKMSPSSRKFQRNSTTKGALSAAITQHIIRILGVWYQKLGDSNIYL